MRYYDLSRLLNMELPIVEGQKNGLMTFSGPQPHGEKDSVLGMVMMTRIQNGKEVFVHASDIQIEHVIYNTLFQPAQAKANRLLNLL